MVTKTKNVRVYKGPKQTVLDLPIGEPGNGFNVLLKAGKREWTVEQLILQPKWKPLFRDWVPEKANVRLGRFQPN